MHRICVFLFGIRREFFGFAVLLDHIVNQRDQELAECSRRNRKDHTRDPRNDRTEQDRHDRFQRRQPDGFTHQNRIQEQLFQQTVDNNIGDTHPPEAMPPQAQKRPSLLPTE